MRGEGEQVDLCFPEIDRDLTERLHRVGMEGCTPLMAELCHRSDRLNHARLVVGPHNCHKRRTPIRRQVAGECIEIQEAALIDRRDPHVVTRRLERSRGLDHGFVLDARADDAAAGMAASEAQDRQVVGLAAGPGEDDASSRGAECG